MKWQGRRASSNVEDRRGMTGGKLVGGGITGVIIVAIVTLLSGGSLGDVLGNVMSTGSGTVSNPQQTVQQSEQQEELSRFVSVVLADTEDVWSEVFREHGMTYENPKLVLYSGSVQSACGTSSSAVGPFYCPGDHNLYIDLSFYDELQSEFKAPGDFAMAYVIAHEVGHHVQTLLGTTDKYNARMQQDNEYQVRFELQADYLAGVWAHYAQDQSLLDVGDIDEALTAASAVGDDTLQKRAQGYAVPESFTHGTSEQRKRWFQKGFDAGTIEGGDTFGAGSL